MSDENTIHIKAWNSNTYQSEFTGEKISVYSVARSITPQNLAKLLDAYLNLGGRGFGDGKEVGHQLRSMHRTLQRLAACFALGLIVGLSEQEYTDARNETAIATARKLAQMVKDGQLPMGLYL